MKSAELWWERETDENPWRRAKNGLVGPDYGLRGIIKITILLDNSSSCTILLSYPPSSTQLDQYIHRCRPYNYSRIIDDNEFQVASTLLADKTSSHFL